MKKISIIIPCYQVDKYIDRCINSLLNQTIGMDNLELIFVDDCSTDKTVDIIKSYKKKYPDNIIVVECEENGRQGRARNIGLTYATGEYIGFVDADDWIEPEMYEHMYEKIDRYDCDVVFCRNERDSEYGFLENVKIKSAEDKLIYISDGEERKKFIVSNIIGLGVWDKLYKRELIYNNNIRFPEGVAYEDIYFGGMIYLYACKIYILEEKLYHYFVNWSSTVLTGEQKYSNDLQIVNQYKYDEYEKRGFKNEYGDELEFDMICTFYLAAIKMFSLRFKEFPYDEFIKVKQKMKEFFPDAQSNKYIKTNLSELNKLLVETLETHIKEKEMTEIAGLYKSMSDI